VNDLDEILSGRMADQGSGGGNGETGTEAPLAAGQGVWLYGFGE
jgi:hypothetical protein